MQVFRFLFISFLITSCIVDNNKIKVENEFFILKFHGDSLYQLPPESKYSGGFVLNYTDTFYYNIGFSVHPLSEDTSSRIFRETFFLDLNELTKDTFFKVESYNIKMVSLIDTLKKGLIGLYTDSILETEYGRVAMNIYCERLSNSSYSMVFNSLNNVKIKVWDTSLVKIPIGTLFIP